MRRAAAALGLLAIVAAGDDGSGLTLTDLAPYRAALERPAEGPAVAVTFRDLWDHPDRYEGRRVRVEGRVARRFRQGPVGTFPALAEFWTSSPSGDLLCLVSPAAGASARGSDAAPGALVRFEGTYLKRVRYQGGDVPRLAPLIVGDRPPAVTAPAPPREAERSTEQGRGPDRVEWTVGLTIAGLVALVLARRHLAAPRRPSRAAREVDPPPEFVDGA